MAHVRVCRAAGRGVLHAAVPAAAPWRPLSLLLPRRPHSRARHRHPGVCRQTAAAEETS
jgi:hypothetical protein